MFCESENKFRKCEEKLWLYAPFYKIPVFMIIVLLASLLFYLFYAKFFYELHPDLKEIKLAP